MRTFGVFRRPVDIGITCFESILIKDDQCYFLATVTSCLASLVDTFILHYLLSRSPSSPRPALRMILHRRNEITSHALDVIVEPISAQLFDPGTRKRQRFSATIQAPGFSSAALLPHQAYWRLTCK